MYHRLGLDDTQLAALRERATQWRARLRTGSTDSPPGPVELERQAFPYRRGREQRDQTDATRRTGTGPGP